MQQEIWGFMIVLYLFLGGLGAGAFAFSLLGRRGLLGEISDEFISRGARAGFWLVGIGTLLLVMDLATLNPFKILRLFSQPTSMMSLGTWILTGFLLLSFFYKKEQKCWRNLAGLVLSFGVMGYTGLLLYALPAIALWHNGFLPLLFVLSALSSGLALNLSAQIKAGLGINSRLKALASILAASELVVCVLWLASACASPAGYESVRIITSGSLALMFWVGFVGLGILPSLYSGAKLLSPSVQANGTLKCACEISKGCVWAEYCAILGSFCLRAVVIYAGVYLF